MQARPLSPRLLLALIGFGCMAVLTAAWYLQYGPDRQQPCPLCILQRYLFIALAAVSLAAAALGPGRTGSVIGAALADLCAACGLGVAIWQLTKGAAMASCLEDPVGVFVNALPTADWWPEYFFANGGCADKYPPFLGLHTPQWSLLWFAVFTALTTLALVLALRRKPGTGIG